MPQYTFMLRDGPSTDPEFSVEEFKENKEAIAFAREQLAHRPRFITVEVYLRDKMVALVER